MLVQKACSSAALTSWLSLFLQGRGLRVWARLLLNCFCCQEMQKSEVMPVVSTSVLSTCLFTGIRRDHEPCMVPQHVPQGLWGPILCAWSLIPDKASHCLCRTTFPSSQRAQGCGICVTVLVTDNIKVNFVLKIVFQDTALLP